MNLDEKVFEWSSLWKFLLIIGFVGVIVHHEIEVHYQGEDISDLKKEVEYLRSEMASTTPAIKLLEKRVQNLE